jgi:hypothetical protein
MAVYFESRAKHTNEFCGQNTDLLPLNVALNGLVTIF